MGFIILEFIKNAVQYKTSLKIR